MKLELGLGLRSVRPGVNHAYVAQAFALWTQSANALDGPTASIAQTFAPWSQVATAADWSPLSLGSDLKLWLRSDLGITTVSGKVSNWADQSGNGLSVSSTSNRPTYSASDSTINNRPSVQITSATWLFGAGTVASGTNPTVVIVQKFGSTAQQCSFSVGNQSSNSFALFLDLGATHERDIDIVGSGNVEDSSSSATTSWEIWRFNSSSSVQTLFVDGSSRSVTGATRTVSSPAAGLVVGADTSGGGNQMVAGGAIAEIIVVDRALTAGEIASLSAYTTGLYNLAA